MNINNLKDLILYQNENTNKSIEVLYDNEDFWLTQKTMAELFNVKPNTISYHLNEIYETKELIKNSTNRKIRQVQKEGNRNVEREFDFYSLDAIIAVGYRVNSKEATNTKSKSKKLVAFTPPLCYIIDEHEGVFILEDLLWQKKLLKSIMV